MLLPLGYPLVPARARKNIEEGEKTGCETCLLSSRGGVVSRVEEVWNQFIPGGYIGACMTILLYDTVEGRGQHCAEEGET
jgi:hypothetical protein